jgi:polyhydroxybutyrate depolymerase
MHYRLIFPFLLLLCSRLVAQTTETLMFDGLERSFIRYVPSGYTPGQQLPLVIVMHGFTQTAAGIMGYSNFNTLAETDNFIVIYPNGVNNAWNIFSTFPGASTADDVGFIHALIDLTIQDYGVNPARVYACGLSAGGFMSHRLACELSHKITAIASVAGTMTTGAFNACAPNRPVPVFQIHGTADAIVSYNGGLGNKSVTEILNYWTATDTCAVPPAFTALPDLINEGSTVEKYLWTPCAGNAAVQHYKIINGGHTWPGASFSGFGNTNMDFSATTEIWNFFKQFSLPQTTGVAGSDKALFFRVFPNPATQHLRVEHPNGRLQRLRLLNLQGALMYDSGPMNQEVWEGSLQSFARGLWLLEISDTAGTQRQLLVKE